MSEGSEYKVRVPRNGNQVYSRTYMIYEPEKLLEEAYRMVYAALVKKALRTEQILEEFDDQLERSFYTEGYYQGRLVGLEDAMDVFIELSQKGFNPETADSTKKFLEKLQTVKQYSK